MTAELSRRRFLQVGLGLTGAMLAAQWEDWATATMLPVQARIPQIEQTWRDQYAHYFGSSRGTVQSADDIIATLQRLTQETGNQLALIYLVPSPEGLEQVLVRPGRSPYYYRQTDLPTESLVNALDDYRDQPHTFQRFLPYSNNVIQCCFMPHLSGL